MSPANSAHVSLSSRLFPAYSHFCVGSLPFDDPEEAVSFVLSRPYILPFWPELPKRSDAELMLNRARGALSSSWKGYSPAEAAGLYALRDRLKKEKRSLPLLKCQVLGPLTFVMFVHDFDEGRDEALTLAGELCLRQIEWQQQFLAETGSALLFVLDEPALGWWNVASPDAREKLREVYSTLCVGLSERRLYLGLHACSAFHPGFLNLPLDLLSFDAGPDFARKLFQQDLAANLSAAAARGLVLAPGVFPAFIESDLETFHQEGLSRFESLKALFSPDGDAVALLSASCGHAGASLEWLDTLYPAC